MTWAGVRTRWAAIGAAIAVSLGAGGLGLAHATNPTEAVALVPITPCRVADTRPDSNVGDRNAPLGNGDTMSVSTRPIAGGDHAGGQCSGVIPAEATGVSLNVTAVGATQPTYLTVWPAGGEPPTASSLNPTPGAPPTPNAVMTGISPDGQFNVFNLQGEVHVVIDINGYYVDHHHDDRYVTRAELAAGDPGHVVVGAEQFVADPGATVEYGAQRVTALDTTVLQVCLTAPALLPNGASITRLRARMLDNSPTQNSFATLVRLELSSTVSSNVQFVSSTGASSQLRTFVADNPGRDVVNSFTHRFVLVACLQPGGELGDVIVNYTWPA